MADLDTASDTSRPGTRAVVTAAIPSAADIGGAQIAAGGNAFDAAVAAALAESVWLPMKCGLGGDVVAIFRRNGGPVTALLSIGRGPMDLGHGARLEKTGPRSVGAMGAPAGYSALAAMGRRSLPDLVAPAIALAESGVFWTEQAVRLTTEAEADLRAWNDTLPFLPAGALPVAGHSLRLPGYARLLERFSNLGNRLFHGEIGQAVVERVSALGGFIKGEDLIGVVATELPASCHDLGAAGRLYTTPHPTHGAIVSMAMRAIGSGMDEVQAVRDTRRAFSSETSDDGTSVVAAADAEGNRVVLVHSNSFPQYGSCVVVPDYDLILNNRPGRGYALDAGSAHWNRPRPDTIPGTTLNAWHLDSARSEFWGGTPGGENQAVWNVQTLSKLIEGASPQSAVAAPKWSLARNGALVFEADHSDAGQPDTETIPAASQRSALQVIAIDNATGAMTTGTDPRYGTGSCHV